MFDLAEKRYLLDQALDHELNALINTLKYNLKIIGYPIKSRHGGQNKKNFEENPFKKPLHSYSDL